MDDDPIVPWPLRLQPGADLRQALQVAAQDAGLQAAFVLAGIGSLRPAALRMAGADEATLFDVDTELLTLSGTLGAGGPHLHASVSLPDGRVIGGHVAPGCRVRTTAEVLLLGLAGQRFDRQPDAATGYAELVIQPRRRDVQTGAGGTVSAEPGTTMPPRSPTPSAS